MQECCIGGMTGISRKPECSISWFIKHIHNQRVAGCHSFVDIRTLCWLCILVYVATSWTDIIIQFVTGYSILYFLLHFLFHFHRYLHNIVCVYIHTYIYIYMCVCVCVCVYIIWQTSKTLKDFGFAILTVHLHNFLCKLSFHDVNFLKC